MDDMVRLKNMPSPPLCFLLMRHFRVPTPGVRLCRLRFPGYSGQDVRRSFRYLRRRCVLDAKVVQDADGIRFDGQLVSLTSLGRLVLNMMENWPDAGVTGKLEEVAGGAQCRVETTT